MTQENKPKRGGKREGAGRKALPKSKKKKARTFLLTPDVIAFLDTQPSATATIEMSVREYADRIRNI